MDRTVTALKNNEEEIVCGFSGDPKDFIRKCTEIGIYSRAIGRSIKKSFEALDSNVPRDVSIRYLLVHAYDGLQGNQRLFQPFLKVLAKYGVPTELILKVTQSFRSMETVGSGVHVGDTLSPGSTGNVVAGTKQPCKFLERHISALTEILADHSSKWQNIGTSLNIPLGVLNDIMTRIHIEDSIMRLTRVLVQWIVRQHEHAKPPTVENLKTALRSKTVSLGIVADQLDDNLIKHGICLNDEGLSLLAKRQAITPTIENLKVPLSQTAGVDSVATQKHEICLDDEWYSSLAKRPLLDAPLLNIVSQSLDTLIQEEKSTFLEVQVVARHGTTISYQWLKDDLPLEEGEDFIGINKPILCINNSCIAKSEGAYVCKITSEDDLTYSEHINVSVSIPPLKKVLMERYCAQPEIPEDSWPPRGGNTYINLALIKQGSIEKAGEYARNTIQGDMDDIFANKDSIEYEDVFTNLESGTRLLIEGRPGSGKTTLVHKFSQDWGRGKLQLKTIKLVFLVHLRGFFNDSKIGLRDIVQNYYTQESKDIVEQILKYSVDHNGEGLCFILDGLDEYNPDSKDQTFIFQLINKQLLPKAIVIVASRPAATAKLRNIATRQVEVIGFLKQQIYKYVEKYKFSDIDKRIDLHKYLDHHPNVHHMCYLPIHAAMVCYLFNVMGSKLPRTETKMYIEFTNHTLLRTLTRYKEKITYLESPDKLLDQDKRIFSKICKLAFEKTASSRQVLRKSEIPHFSDISSGSESMGLITVDEMSSVCGLENLYTFLHLTFQEYLAAYHISKLEEEKQLEVITQYSQKKHMIVVWKFYCGLVNFNEQEQRLIKIMSLKDDLFNVHCAFESQQTVTCDSVVMTGESGTLSFNNHFLTPSDSTAIGYVVKNAKCLVEKVVLDGCTLSQEGVDALIIEAGEKISSLKAFSFHGMNCFMEQFQLLNTCLRAMVSIEVLDISNTKIGVEEVKLLVERLTLSNLQTLKFSSSMLDNYKGLLQSLVFNSPKFRQVLLADGGLPHHQGLIVEYFGFSPFLHGCGSLAHVNLQDHLFEPGEFDVLSSSINQFSCCTNLCLTNCNICDDVGALKNLALLKSFDVSVNGISDNGATAVADNIQHFKNLQNLNMSVNHIGDSGAIALAKSLHLLYDLEKIDLSYNRIGDKGAMALAESLHLLCDLKKNDLSDFEALTPDSLHLLCDLKKIDLSNFEALIPQHPLFDLKKKDSSDFVDESLLDLSDSVYESLLDLSDSVYESLLCDLKKIDLSDSQVLTSFESLYLLHNLKKIIDSGALTHDEILYDLEKINLNDSGALTPYESLHLLYNLKKKIDSGELTHYDLKKIDLSDSGALTLAKSLHLLYNLISGAMALAESHDLDLSIGDKGAVALAVSLHLLYDLKKIVSEVMTLAESHDLKKIDLSYNRIGDEGAIAVTSAIKDFQDFEFLLWNHRITKEGVGTVISLKPDIKLKFDVLDLMGMSVAMLSILADNVEGDIDQLGKFKVVSFKVIKQEAFLRVLAILKQCMNLEEVNLEGYDFHAFIDGINHCTELKTLHLERSNTGATGAQALANLVKHNPNLQTLSLSANRIGPCGVKALADGLMNCTSIQTLNLNENCIGNDGAMALADSLKHCTNLQMLCLNNNEICTDGVKALADGLKYCTNLQTLHLSHNEICSDGVKALTDGLKNCNNLLTLLLDSNTIGTDGAKALSDCLKHWTNLQTLHLNCNRICTDGAKALTHGLKQCTNLHTLNLNWNEIGIDGAKTLADGLKHCTNLQALHLDDNEIGPDGAKALANGLKHCTNLLKLHLYDNEIGADGVKALADGLKHCTNLQTLDLVINEIGTEGAKALADSLKHCTNLQTLHLDYNKIGTDGAMALADGLKHCTNLQTLHLNSNEIGTDGAKAFADCLKHCTNLQTFHLDGNGIGAYGAMALTDGLKHCTNLETLHLDCNEIGTDGAKALAYYLEHCTNLQKLHLNNNEIGTDGLKALAVGLKHCTNLQTLHLDGNGIDADGTKALADCIKHCTNLQILHLDGNEIGTNGAKALADGLRNYTNLRTLHLAWNKIGADGANALGNCLENCTNLYSHYLDYNEIETDDGAKVLKYCTNLQTLHLDHNEIGTDGAKAFADGLKHFANLQTLHLDGNEIGAYGTTALAYGLKHCTNLQTLHLDVNEICADGAKAFADGLENCTNLQTLHLALNKIGTDGAKALADGIKHCTNLQTLRLDGNEIGTDGAKALVDRLKHCTNLQTLHLGGNGIGADGAKSLADSLKHCTIYGI